MQAGGGKAVSRSTRSSIKQACERLSSAAPRRPAPIPIGRRSPPHLPAAQCLPTLPLLHTPGLDSRNHGRDVPTCAYVLLCSRNMLAWARAQGKRQHAASGSCQRDSSAGMPYLWRICCRCMKVAATSPQLRVEAEGRLEDGAQGQGAADGSGLSQTARGASTDSARRHALSCRVPCGAAAAL